MSVKFLDFDKSAINKLLNNYYQINIYLNRIISMQKKLRVRKTIFFFEKKSTNLYGHFIFLDRKKNVFNNCLQILWDIIVLIRPDYFPSNVCFNLEECMLTIFENLKIFSVISVCQVTVTYLHEIVWNVTFFICISHKSI